MKLYIVRHGVAGERDARRWPDDDDRPLTPDGAQKFHEAARGLRLLDPGVTRVITSPVVRARQTAEILLERLKERELRLELDDSLRYDAPLKRAWELVRHFKDDENVALVGHEPHLSMLIACLIAADEEGCNVEMKKGAVACLDGQDRSRPGRLVLRWLMTQKQLAKLNR